jgi:hypothetical protein
VAVRVDAHGYLEIAGTWQSGDRVGLQFELPIRVLRSHPKARETFGLVALQRGPLIYCIEEIDNGPDLHLLTLDMQAPMASFTLSGLGDGVLAIRAAGWRLPANLAGPLYSDQPGTRIACEIVLVPYYSWGNRGAGEMRVWLNS